MRHKRNRNISFISGTPPPFKPPTLSWAADRSDQFTGMRDNTNSAVVQHAAQCFSSSLLCSCVPISSTVQVGALGVVSMDTKQLARIQNRTWRVAYLQALGARKSYDDSVLILCYKREKTQFLWVMGHF